ncbi:MAG: zf-TFIIB domain-containing protein [Dehalococcoidia bacterium]
MLKCPRDGSELVEERHQDIEVDHCPTCNGRWLDEDELDLLESSVAPDEDHRRATIEYAKRPSELNCPVCGEQMRAFNYRAYNLEIDTCPEAHGFWLDAGEEGSVRDIMEERVRGLERAASAEQSWGKFLGRVGRRSVWNDIKRKFGSRR